ncbi:MAG TPA: heme-binding protein [Micropepsaceae bacterium]|nr:heme-binding protein [Micropepsaceae bacterium]
MSRISLMLKAAVAAGVLCAAAVPAQAQSSSITSEQAMAALRAVQAYAKNDGSDPSLTVLDRDGNVVLMLKGNGAAPHNIGLSLRKAQTANLFKMKSIDWRDKTMPGKPDADQRNTPNAIPLGGGVPIMVGNEIIGAVGVSGTRGGQEGDTAGAQAGADAAAAMVKRLQASN